MLVVGSSMELIIPLYILYVFISHFQMSVLKLLGLFQIIFHVEHCVKSRANDGGLPSVKLAVTD